MIESDYALVLKSQKSDRDAFEQLMRRTARLVYSRIYLDIRDSHRAEDLTQETFITAWKRIGQMADPSGFRPWLMAIARTTTIDAQRHESRKKRQAPGCSARLETMQLAVDSESDPAQLAERSEQRQKVLDLLAELPSEYRQPIMLRYIGGADYDAIGRQLGLTTGALRGLLNRGMTRLKALMQRSEMPQRPPMIGSKTD